MNWRYVRYGVLIAASTYTWFKFFKEWYELQKQYKKHLLFLKRHNCVVMYWYNSAGKRIGDWPCDDSDDPADDDIKGTNVIRQYEPILYFIRTAKESLYIATMFIHVQCIVDELLVAHTRNVIIKIIVYYNYNKSGTTCIQQLQRAGIEVLYYVPPDPDQCISMMFHYNYVVKDFSRDTQDGYLCKGLLNWSVNGVVPIYEILNFTSMFELVAQFRDSFEDAWNIISEMNETNDYIKDTLREINMYQ
ncbi:hypothetical protein RI129_011217 [Pyrocoelia pectoralis]|uniref:Mitochondrial cardiolipin hydrolase n=1 Tax=Pyrocoelia pectoralis TaxID=417401 RepID=A0AAN7V7M7_9COLE